MNDQMLRGFFANEGAPYAVILGVNEIASAVAVRLCWEGCRVVMSHDPFPPVIRRKMSFHDALFDDRAEVDGIFGQRADNTLEIVEALAQPGRVAVTALPLTDLITLRRPHLVVDARMQKQQVTPDLRGIARLAIGLGPNFAVGANCDVAIETHPDRAGGILFKGKTRSDDGVAPLLGGAGKDRFAYSMHQGVWRTPLDIGTRVFKDFIIGHLDRMPIKAPRDGFLRGIARDGISVPAGVKIAEIDPRGRAASWTGTDERGRAVAAAVVAAAIKEPRRRLVTSKASMH